MGPVRRRLDRRRESRGIATLTGFGQGVGGRGEAKGLKSTYTHSGAFNTKTGRLQVTLTSTYMS
jgi:hypothetical protein